MHIASLRFRGVGLAALLLVGSLSLSVAQTYWFESYQRAVELIDDGRLDEAAELLTGVLRDNPVPVYKARMPGNQYLDYLPYYQRARIEYQRGEFEAASHSLDVSEAFGAIRQSRHAASELSELRRKVAASRERQRSEMAGAISLALPPRR